MRSTINPKRLLITLAICLLLIVVLTVTAAATTDEEEALSSMYGTIWALVAPVVAIALALITKEVYSSLFVGILIGALFNAGFNLTGAWVTMFKDGFIASLSDSWNMGILIFLVIIGVIVVLINKAGGSIAYGEWAAKRIKSRRGAMLSVFVLGLLIFIDDYFNCLTVGNVMRPVTDTHKISRAKLAYLVDATAAPVCMIAPISSWAAAVAGVAGFAGLTLFVRAIPYNFYSLLTFVMIIGLIALNFDFGPMKRHEKNAQENGDLFTTGDRPYTDASEQAISSKGKVIDLVVPIIVLIIACISGMVYTGGFFEGVNFIEAFADCDASLGLPLGSFLALLFTFIYFLCRRVLSFKQCMEALPAGFAAMVPAILILTFAWTLSAMTGMLGADVYVAGLIEGSAAGFVSFLPVIIFIIAAFLSFATGTSWGTFGILIPIIVGVFTASDPLLVLSISACLAGAIFGDHCSPISDTTIMSSTGAQYNHINHVSTQLPYAITVAALSIISYVIAGLFALINPNLIILALPVGIVITFLTLILLKSITKAAAPQGIRN
ncbi:MAG: Na+/H+ antiporter NhaC family protein [Clostridiales bacterium]|jgi:Na+/H+ antiporter NhaC|nr:Na+/H+ antiporter NhaC family protein [Clostridiales bacterium]